jgi:hypothetical protein
MVVNRTSSALDSGVSTQVEVILEWMGDISLNERTRKGIGVAVTSLSVILLGEEADVVTLGADYDGPLDLSKCQKSHE